MWDKQNIPYKGILFSLEKEGKSFFFFFESSNLSSLPFIYLFFLTLFYFGIQPINNVVIVSGAQQNASATHICGCILSQIPLPTRLPHKLEQSSLSYTIGSYLFSLLNYSSVYMLIPNSMTVPCPLPFLLVRISLFSKSQSVSVL